MHPLVKRITYDYNVNGHGNTSSNVRRKYAIKQGPFFILLTHTYKWNSNNKKVSK